MQNNASHWEDAITATDAAGKTVAAFPSREDFERAMIYAQFGQTISLAQLLQRDVVNALMLMRIMEPDLPTITQFVCFIEHQESATFPTLLSRLREFADVPAELSELLAAAADRSTYLEHRFFTDTDTTASIGSAEGRATLFNHLREDTELFRETARILEEAIAPIRKARLGSD